tara:strand:- start:42 stop:266 length:225 start_codon:yes stop_codon:yes gene_type:complete
MKKRLTLYELLLLFIGLATTSIGFLLINLTYKAKGPSWDALIALFLWLILLTLFIGLAAIQEAKESILNQKKNT